MKGFVAKIGLSCALLLCSMGVWAQQPARELSGCLQAGNASCLSSHMGSAVTLTLLQDGGTYSRAQADMVLRDFFKKNAPRGFKLGKSSDSHIIGTLTTEKGVYRVFITITVAKDGYAVQEIRMEK